MTVAKKANELYGNGDGLWIFPTRTNANANFTLDGNTSIKWLNKWESYIVPGMAADDVDAAINNDSLTFKLTYETGDTMIFTGDISWTPQRDLVDNCKSDIQNATIVKIPHHGILDYQNPVFRKTALPEYSICTPNLDALNISDVYNQGSWGGILNTKKLETVGTDNAYYTIVLRKLLQNGTHVYIDPLFPKYLP